MDARTGFAQGIGFLKWFWAVSLVAGLLSFPSGTGAATYSNGVFQFDDPGGKYTVRFVFDGASEPLPVKFEERTEVHPTAGYSLSMTYFNLGEPQTEAVLGWQVTGDLATTVSLSRSNYLWDWSSRVGITANPFRMAIGKYYRFSFSVNDPSYGVSQRRPVEFYFAPQRMTYPPAIDQFSAYPGALRPGETTYFTCEAHDTGTWGSEYLIFRLDANGDGTYDSEKLGVLVNPADDPFRGVRGAEFSVKYNNTGVFGARCQVENIRQEVVVSAPFFISVGDHQIGVVGRPNDGVDLGTAVIPPDERFPARYRLTLTDRNTGEPAGNVTLSANIDHSPQARLDSGLQSGSSIQLVTDENGEAEFTYTFLDVPPKDAPYRGRIVIESTALGIRQTVEVSVGLKLRVANVTEAWDSRTEVPRTLGLRIQLLDAFRPHLDLEAWVAALKHETGRHLGFAATTWWLNRPEPDTVQWIKDYVKGFTSPPDDTLYVDGRGWVKKINDQFVFQAIDHPMMSIGPHTLPTLTLNSEGLHLFELRMEPVILPDEPTGTSLDIVKSAPPYSFFFGADVYGAESVFQSVVCAFSPTDAEQFLLKSVFLDCPLLTTAQCVGEWAAGTAVPYVLLVAEVADMICSFMEGNYLSVGAALAGKYLSRLDSLREAEAIELTERELSLLKKGLVASSIKKFYDTYNDSVKHFWPSSSRLPAGFEPLSSMENWPGDLDSTEMLDALTAMSAGFMCVPQMEGLESLTTIGAGDVTAAPSGETVTFQSGEVGVHLYAAGDGPGVATNATVDLFRIGNVAASRAVLQKYRATSAGENLSLMFSGDALQVDRGGDGSVDELVDPQSIPFGFNAGDVNLDGVIELVDGMIALQIAVNGPAGKTLLLPWAVDVNGDTRLGLEEAIYILSRVAGIRSPLSHK